VSTWQVAHDCRPEADSVTSEKMRSPTCAWADSAVSVGRLDDEALSPPPPPQPAKAPNTISASAHAPSIPATRIATFERPLNLKC